MSDLTVALLQQPRRRRTHRWHTRMQEITDLLVEEHGTPTLGNYADPIKEIFYIALSARTTEKLYQNAHKQLWKRFPTLKAIANAPISDLREVVAGAGLGTKRSSQIKAIAAQLLEDFGPRTRSRLRQLSAEDAFAYLCHLPGLGPKSALCVMMYSLGFDVFPVDSHAQRILTRIGLPLLGDKHYHAQQQLPAYIPKGRSKELHVALVSHGRAICRSRLPKCASCSLSSICDSSSLGSSSLNSSKKRISPVVANVVSK